MVWYKAAVTTRRGAKEAVNDYDNLCKVFNDSKHAATVVAVAPPDVVCFSMIFFSFDYRLTARLVFPAGWTGRLWQ